MRYVEDGASLPPAGGPGLITSHVFVANSIHDPNSTGVGHQPYGHDTIATVYGRYRVLSAKCTATFAANSAVANSGKAVIQVSTVGAATSNPTLFLEQPDTTYKTLPTGNAGSVTVVKHFNARRFFGPKSGDRLTSNFGTSPTELAFFLIGVVPLDDTVTMGGTQLHVTITYKVLLSEPLALGSS